MAIELDVQAGVARITINRPERMNAMNPAMYEALSEAWQQVRDDKRVRCAVITGAGEKAFCAGADLKEPMTTLEDDSEFWMTQKNPLLNRGLELWKPVVAAVNGYCLGGGMTILLATDIRFSVPSAEFGVPEVRRGLLPGNGGTQRILEQLPHAIAMEMLLLGKRIDADTAARWGLVNAVVDADDLLPTALECAERIAALPTGAVQASKELALRSRDMDRSTGLRMEMTMLRMLNAMGDAVERKEAFAHGDR